MAVIRKRVRVNQQRAFRFGRRVTRIRVGPDGVFFVFQTDFLCSKSLYFRSRLQKKRKPMQGDCTICHEEVQPGIRELSYCASCGNNFHFDCLEQWVQVPTRNSCPLCRTVFRPPSQEDVLNFSDAHPKAFEIYSEWLYTGNISIPDINPEDNNEEESYEEENNEEENNDDAEIDLEDNYNDAEHNDGADDNHDADNNDDDAEMEQVTPHSELPDCQNAFDLCEAYALGHQMKDKPFCRAVIEAWIEFVADTHRYPGPVCITSIYERFQEMCSIKEMVIELYSHYVPAHLFENEGASAFPQQFLEDLLVAAMKTRGTPENIRLEEMKDSIFIQDGTSKDM